MDFELENELFKFLVKDELDKAIQYLESKFYKVPNTIFHNLIGRDFLNSTNELINNLQISSKKCDAFLSNGLNNHFTKAYFVTSEDFTINFHGLTIDFFGFKDYKGLDNTNWLAYYDYFEFDNEFEILNASDVINVFSSYDNSIIDDNYEMAHSMAYYLIVLRIQELYRNAILEGRRQNLDWARIPILVSCHDSEFIYDSSNLKV